jgi:dTMP kinase
LQFIVIDGIDGAGKSMMAAWIAEHYRMRGEKVMVRTHPSGTWFGRMSQRSLTAEGRFMHAVAALFFISDVLDSVRMLRRWESYDKVIFVRYVMATAYLPKRLYLPGYRFFCKVLPVPSRLLLVDTTPECALRRIEEREHDREMFENLASLREVRDRALRLAGEGWSILDNSGSVKDARSQLESVLSQWESLN